MLHNTLFRGTSAVLWLALATSAVADETPVDAVFDCRSLPSAEERLKCYDDTVDKHAQDNSVTEEVREDAAAVAEDAQENVVAAEEVQEAAAAAPDSTAVAETAESANEAADAAMIASAAAVASETSETVVADAGAIAEAEEEFGLPAVKDAPDVKQIESAILGLSRMSSGKFAIELENGQTWRQTSTSSMRLSEGEVVIIKRGSLGSYKLTKAGTKRSMKVKRVN